MKTLRVLLIIAVIVLVVIYHNTIIDQMGNFFWAMLICLGIYLVWKFRDPVRRHLTTAGTFIGRARRTVGAPGPTDLGFQWIYFVAGLVIIGLVFLVLGKFTGLWNQFSGSGWLILILVILVLMLFLASLTGVRLGWVQGVLGLLLIICLIAAFGFINPKKVGGIIAPGGRRYADSILVQVPASGLVKAWRQIPKGMAPSCAMQQGKVNVYANGTYIGWVDAYRHWFDPSFEGGPEREFESADGKPTEIVLWLYYLPEKK